MFLCLGSSATHSTDKAQTIQSMENAESNINQRKHGKKLNIFQRLRGWWQQHIEGRGEVEGTIDLPRTIVDVNHEHAVHMVTNNKNKVSRNDVNNSTELLKDDDKDVSSDLLDCNLTDTCNSIFLDTNTYEYISESNSTSILPEYMSVRKFQKTSNPVIAENDLERNGNMEAYRRHLILPNGRNRSKSENDLSPVFAGTSHQSFRDSAGYVIPSNIFVKHVSIDGSDSVYMLPSNVLRLDQPGSNNGPDLPPKNGSTNPNIVNIVKDIIESKSEDDLTISVVRAGTSYQKFQDNLDYLIPDNKFAKLISIDGSDSIYKVPSGVPRLDQPGSNDGPELSPKKTPRIAKPVDTNKDTIGSKAVKDKLISLARAGTSHQKFQNNLDYLIPDNKFAKRISIDALTQYIKCRQVFLD